MSKSKLLIITAGTVAANVGQEILKQMEAHPGSDLTVMVRHIDTAYLPKRYELSPGEWFQMSIDQRYMEAVHQRIKEFPNLERMLFSNLLPGTDVSGGGSIRYNGAAAVEVQRDNLRKWLSSSMTDLANSGGGERLVSMALIVSAVGATGSGSLEHLVNVIVDAANHANIKSTNQGTVRCDVFIMQPGMQGVTDLGLANTLALYAELAASQLSQNNTNARRYQGRKIMIGWGSNRALSSIEQLIAASATLVRLCSDPSSAFAAEFQEREVDNHVLRELDPLTTLPMHLSLATVVTISLGRLEEQIIQRDVRRLINNLVFDTTASGAQVDVLLARLAEALGGDSPRNRYMKLLEHLSEVVDFKKMKSRLDGIAGNMILPATDRASQMKTLWEEQKEKIKQARERIEDRGRTLIRRAINTMEQTQRERICQGGISLAELREEYRSLQAVLNAILDVARAETETSVDDAPVTRQLEGVRETWWDRLSRRQIDLTSVTNAMKGNLQKYLQERARPTAILVLEELEGRCAEIGRNLDVVLKKLRRQLDNNQNRVGANSQFNLETGHPLNMVVLSSKDEIDEYANRVSIFTSRSRSQRRSSRGDVQEGDSLAEFRQWLEGHEELGALFKGDLDLLTNVARTYTTEKVHEEVERYSVIDILLQAGEEALRQRLEKAAERASSLVDYSKDFAPERREAWHVSAYWPDEDDSQRAAIEKAIKQVFKEGQCKLLPSNDPTEVAIFYYVDGIPMSAVDDLKGRCLEALLKRRQQWYRQQKSLNGNRSAASMTAFNQRVGVPVYSGKDAEERVLETGVIQRLYSVKGSEVGEYKEEDIPELSSTPYHIGQADSDNHAHQNSHAGQTGQTSPLGETEATNN